MSRSSRAACRRRRLFERVEELVGRVVGVELLVPRVCGLGRETLRELADQLEDPLAACVVDVEHVDRRLVGRVGS